jgi:feruloyl-CoA synthase
MNAPKFRPLQFGVTRVNLRDGAPGTHYLQADQALAPYPDRITDRLQHWAQIAPERTFMARRVALPNQQWGDWRHVSWGEAWQTAQHLAQALINRGAPGGHLE